MKTIDPIQLSLTIKTNESNLKEIESQRNDFIDFLSTEMTNNITINKPTTTRSIDPIIIGTVTLAILPIVAEKLSDLIIKWMELREDCSVTLKIPMQSKSIEITYNPKNTTPETLKKWVNNATLALSKKD